MTMRGASRQRCRSTWSSSQLFPSSPLLRGAPRSTARSHCAARHFSGAERPRGRPAADGHFPFHGAAPSKSADLAYAWTRSKPADLPNEFKTSSRLGRAAVRPFDLRHASPDGDGSDELCAARREAARQHGDFDAHIAASFTKENVEGERKDGGTRGGGG